MVGDLCSNLFSWRTDEIIANDPLKQFSKTYPVKVEASKRHGVIRVESDFATSEDVVRMITHILDRIKSFQVLTDSVEATTDKAAAKDLDSVYLREVGRLTNTILVKPVYQRSGPKLSPREVCS